MQPNNIIMGDSTGVDLPHLQPNEADLMEEKKMAKYSRSAEFKRIQEHFEARIAFYQQFLPDGREIGGSQPTPEDWRVANTLIKEFNNVVFMYHNASDVVEADSKDKNGR